MKNTMTMGMALALGIGVLLSATSGATGTGQMDKGMMKDGSMTVAGCVAAGKEAGRYMLTNAMMAGMMDKEMMDKGKMDKDKMQPGMGGHMMAYELVGGDLKAHMGHKVEVTGTMSKSDMEKMDKMRKMGMERMAGTSDKDMQALKLNVTSVKRVSATCP